MTRAVLAAAALVAALVAGCGAADVDAPDADAGVDVAEIGRADGGRADAGTADVGAADGARADSGMVDIGATDVGMADVARADVGMADVAGVDAGVVDGGTPDAGPLPEPDFTAIPWTEPGLGVAYRDSENPRGDDVFIGYAGYGAQAAWARLWVAQLFREALHDRGVRHVYAVQGPREAGYDSQEIGNSRLIAHVLPRLAPGARILVAAHSSGGFVASELLQQLYARNLDPTHLTRGRLSYWDLDGATSGLTPAIIGQLHHAWFVWADAAGTRSPNAGVMIAAGAIYASAGGALMLDAGAAGCNRGATWCVHMAPITTRPHNPAGTSVAMDYGSFDATHRVETAWLTRTNFGAP
ncbi:MAG: hypothetical protein KA978_01195 [Deltaproteobacteria bacterium]|nr:hypothetical protein [Deltaproteobacteria bacterium]